MKRNGLNWMTIAALVAVLAITDAPSWAQEPEAETAEQTTDPALDQIEAQEEEAKRQEAEQRRRRRMPQETKIDLGEEQALRITYQQAPIDGPDYPNVANVEPGEVVQFTLSAPPKLWTDVDLVFGGSLLKTHNVADDYPGVYSLWMKRTADGWNMVFNNKPDVWGTMYDPSTDAAEAPAESHVTDDKGEALAITLEETDGGGTINVSWGEYHWSAPFSYK